MKSWFSSNRLLCFSLGLFGFGVIHAWAAYHYYSKGSRTAREITVPGIRHRTMMEDDWTWLVIAASGLLALGLIVLIWHLKVRRRGTEGERGEPGSPPASRDSEHDPEPRPIRPLIGATGFSYVGGSLLWQSYQKLTTPIPGLVETSPGVWRQGEKPDDAWLLFAVMGVAMLTLSIWEVVSFFKKRRDDGSQATRSELRRTEEKSRAPEPG